MSIYINHSTNDISTNAGTKPTLGSVIVREQSEKIAGDLVQRIYSSTVTSTTTTSVIPSDDTIPQNTEGTEVLTATITPTSASNKLRIRAYINFANNAAVAGVCAVFQDTTANAIAAGVVSISAAAQADVLIVEYEMVAGTTSATTFKVRVGPGAAATMTINGSAGARLLGGVLTSTLSIEEVKV